MDLEAIAGAGGFTWGGHLWPWTGRDIPQLIGNACPTGLAAALLGAATAA